MKKSKYIIFFICLLICSNVFCQTYIPTQDNKGNGNYKQIINILNSYGLDSISIKKIDSLLVLENYTNEQLAEIKNYAEKQSASNLVVFDLLVALIEKVNNLQVAEPNSDTLTSKLDYIPFGLAQFKYGKTGKGTLFATLQSVTLLGGGIGAGICFDKYSKYREYAKEEQDDDKLQHYLRQKDNYLWGGIGCLASIVAVYGINIICNKADRKDFLTVSVYSTPQSNGIALLYTF
jgi:hypothetical protein